MESATNLQPQSAVQTLSLHALSFGDGILALSRAPGAGGDYAGDLRLIREWRPSMVISMTTRVEHVILGVENLGTDIQGLGSRWFHMPVEDYQTPTEEMDEHWQHISTMARQAMSGGGRVLVHCRGGCGRSGMAVLRLMIESGEHAEAALRRLRALRPCAVETDAQMAWAFGRRSPT